MLACFLPALFAFLAPFFVVAATIRNLEVLVGVGVWATVSLFASALQMGPAALCSGMATLDH